MAQPELNHAIRGSETGLSRHGMSIYRMFFNVLIAGLAIVAHTAHSEEIPLTHDLDILTIQPVRTEANRLFPYRLKTNVVITRATGTAPAASELSYTPRLHLFIETKKADRFSDARQQILFETGLASLAPILRFESKGGQVDIKPRRHSVWVVWRKDFH